MTRLAKRGSSVVRRSGPAFASMRSIFRHLRTRCGGGQRNNRKGFTRSNVDWFNYVKFYFARRQAHTPYGRVCFPMHGSSSSSSPSSQRCSLAFPLAAGGDSHTKLWRDGLRPTTVGQCVVLERLKGTHQSERKNHHHHHRFFPQVILVVRTAPQSWMHCNGARHRRRPFLH